MAVLVRIFFAIACLIPSAMAETQLPYHYPVDVKRRDVPKLYLVNDSRGHSVTIVANDTVVWRGVIEKSDIKPNIHAVGVPNDSQRNCRIRIGGGPYDAKTEVDWQKGKALIVHFADDRVTFTQREEPVGFQ